MSSDFSISPDDLLCVERRSHYRIGPEAIKEHAMDRLGITIGLEGASLQEAVDLCLRAEDLGYTDVWSAEVGGADGIAALTPVAAQSSRVRLGTGILPVFTRPPALLAMGAATLQNLSGGRFVLGLGTSSPVIVGGWMGGSFDRPLKRLREYVEVIREALSGKKVTYRGETVSLDGFRLQLDPGAPVPIYLAALGLQACRLAGEVADGVIFFLKTPNGVRQGLEWVAEGARAAGRDPTELDCVIRVTAAVDEDPKVLRFVSRRLITTYAAVGVYNRSLAQQGFTQEATAIATAWKAGDREAATQAVSDRLLDELLITGSAEQCREGLAEFRAAGVKTPVLLPVSVAGDPAERVSRVEQAVAALAPRDQTP
jgi:probable F420-dependent oxidoreductase